MPLPLSRWTIARYRFVAPAQGHGPAGDDDGKPLNGTNNCEWAQGAATIHMSARRDTNNVLMSRSRVLIAIAIALVCIAGIFVFMRGGQAPEAETQVADSAPVHPKTVTKKAPERAKGNRDREITLRFDDDPAGNLRLEGSVITSTDDPVAGAIVSIDSRPPRFVQTGEDGSFFFDRLVGRNYDVVARADEGVAGPITARLSETNDPVILTLRPGGSIKVKVVSTDNPTGLSGASVELRGLDSQSGTTDAAGVATFTSVPIGRYGIVAKAEGYVHGQTRVGLSRGGAVADVKIDLKHGAQVSGIVVDPEGTPLPGAQVSYRGASQWSVRSDERLDAVISDKQGRFTVEALPRGSFRFRATAEGFAAGTSELVALDGESETTGVEIAMAAGATLRGRVLNGEGQPVAAARVRVGAQGRGMMRRRRGVRQTYSNDEGVYELTGLPRKKHDVVAMHESATSEIVDADLSVEPYELALNLTMDIDGVIAGMVVDSAGEPVAGAQVTVLPDFRSGARRSRSEWRMRGIATELTDAGGRFKVSGLKDNEYRVRAMPGHVSGRGRSWLVEGVQARVGDEDLRIVLPSDGGIKGKVAFANGEAPELFTVSVGWRQGTPFSSEDGAFELPDLPPQTFTVSVRGPEFDERQVAEVEVKEGETVDLGTVTVYKGRVVSGRVVDSSGNGVKGASVSAGRVIFGDGSSSTTERARNPLARSTKTATSDDNGDFAMSGIAPGDISIVADHETIGRSAPVSVKQSRDSIEGVILTLQATGALEGTVTASGAPAGSMLLTAASLTEPGVTFNVASGEDGRYRFDRLAPDSYKVKVRVGNPMSGMSFYSDKVDILPGETASLDIEVSTDGVSLEVTLIAENDVGFAQLFVVPGVVNATSGRELAAFMGSNTGFEGNSMSIRGRPATAKNLAAGRYSLCAVVYPSEVSGMKGVMDYMNREGDNLPAQCQMIQIKEAPAEQKRNLEVEIPAFVPDTAAQD